MANFGEDLLRSPDVTDENGQELSPRASWAVAGGLRATDTGTQIVLTGDSPGGAIKAPVRVATTANVTLSAPGATIDGVTMASTNRVLVRAQTSGTENGVYVWNGAAVAMTRATDYDGAGDAVAASLITVQEGTTFADTIWLLTTNSPITIGSSTLSYANVPAPAAGSFATQLLAWDGSKWAPNTAGFTLPNNTAIFFEADPAGDDVRAIAVDSSEQLLVGKSGTNGAVRAIYDVKTDGAHRLQINAATMLEAAEVATGRRVVFLGLGANGTTTEMPANTGDRVTFIANAATAPTADPVGGGILYASGGNLYWRSSGGVTTQLN